MPRERFRGNLKRCSRCTRVWPLSPQYWHRRRGRPLGFSAHCRECRNQATAAWHASHPNYAREYKLAHPEKVAASLRRMADRLDPPAPTPTPTTR